MKRSISASFGRLWAAFLLLALVTTVTAQISAPMPTPDSMPWSLGQKIPVRFVAPNGSGTGTAASPAAFTQAFINALPRVCEVRFRPGVYRTTATLTSAAKNILWTAEGDASTSLDPLVSIRGTVNPTSWSVQSGTTYQTTLSAGQTVYAVHLTDLTNRLTDQFLEYPKLVRASSLANCNATADSYFQSGTTLYVNIGEDPTGQTVEAVILNGAILQIVKGTEYAEFRNIAFELSTGAGINVAESQDTNQRTLRSLIAKGCAFDYHFDDTGVAAASGLEIRTQTDWLLYGCRAIRNRNDGLNVKEGSWGQVFHSRFIRNSDEGFSPHLQSRGVMVGCEIIQNGYVPSGFTVAEADGFGVYVVQGSDWTFYDTMFSGCKDASARVVKVDDFGSGANHYGMTRASFYRCTFDARDWSATGPGGLLYYSGRVAGVVRDCHFMGTQNSTAGVGRALQVTNQATLKSLHVVIVNNTFSYCKVGIEAESEVGTSLSRVTLTGNVFTNVTTSTNTGTGWTATGTGTNLQWVSG